MLCSNTGLKRKKSNMKYVITESMAKKIAFESIKDKINELDLYRRTFDSFIIYGLNQNEYDFVGDSVIIEYDFEDGRLYVDLNPFELVLSMYGLNDNTESLKKFFMDWFEHYEGIRPEYVDF